MTASRSRVRDRALSKPVVALVASVDAVAALLSLMTVPRTAVTVRSLVSFAMLVALSLVYLELSRQVEQRRRLFAEGASHMDVSSIWAFAGAIVLPPALAVTLIALIYSHLWIRTWRHVDDRHRYRTIYTAAAIVLSCLASSSVFGLIVPHRDAFTAGAVGALAVLSALLVYRAVNAAVISAAFIVSQRTFTPRILLGSKADNVFEFATLLLGAVTAAALYRAFWFALLVLPAVFLLQYHALLRELVEAATLDAKTELLNATAWRRLAQRELSRAERQGSATSVLVIDMDHFKRINDTYGHLAGDLALKTVAEALSEELREYDAVGRFGGEEFVALVPEAGPRAAMSVAERVRRRIEATEVAVEQRSTAGVERLLLTASIGVASAPRHGAALDELLNAADEALYQAKGAGRNAVCLARSRVAAA